MEDEPLLHSCQFDYLVLEYFFGDGHRESFPNRNPHMNRLMHMIIRMMKSTIVNFQFFKCPDVVLFGVTLCKALQAHNPDTCF